MRLDEKYMKSIIITEKANPQTSNIDLVNTIELVTLLNNEDKKVALAVEKAIPDIAKAIELISDKLSADGHLLYFGAGTSGRLGVLDASECPPTFGVTKELVRGYIAGGDRALRESIEGAEDSYEDGQNDLITSAALKDDVVVSISASGNAPYCCGVLSKAKEIKAATIALTCNREAAMLKYADISIITDVGPEPVTGSTRMKSGTAHKMVLNMLTTASMIKQGKTYHNFMIDVRPVNKKLVDRATRIIAELSGVDYDTASKYLFMADENVKLAVVMIKKQVDKNTALTLLEQAQGKLRLVIG
jgi:N-acetylmuramic acid 6-phosphate etherase